MAGRPKGRQRRPVHTSLDNEVYKALEEVAKCRGIALKEGGLGALLDEAVQGWFGVRKSDVDDSALDVAA